MNPQFKLKFQEIRLKRVFTLVVIIEAVLAVALYAYYDRFQDDFFDFPVNDDGTVTVTGEPLLIGYGEAINPPWVFSAVGTDTLLLNGLPFLPVRAGNTVDILPAEARDRYLTMQAILKEAEDAYLAEEDKVAAIEAFGGILESYLGTVIYSVIIDRNGEQVIVDFMDDLPALTVTFKKSPHWIEREGLLKQKHYEMMEGFITWMKINGADAVFSFGPNHTNLTIGNDTRQRYTSLLEKLNEVAESSHADLSADRMRRTLGEDDYNRWEELILDYVSWRGLHETPIH
jgi:hypothetical protein